MASINWNYNLLLNFVGIKSIAIDVDKDTLTVVGTVDPVCIILALRRKKYCAEIESVDEDKNEEPEKMDDECKKIEECKKLLAETYCVPSCAPLAPYVPYRSVMLYEDPPGCIIS
jgi:hypothetical protein